MTVFGVVGGETSTPVVAQLNSTLTFFLCVCACSHNRPGAIPGWTRTNRQTDGSKVDHTRICCCVNTDVCGCCGVLRVFSISQSPHRRHHGWLTRECFLGVFGLTLRWMEITICLPWEEDLPAPWLGRFSSNTFLNVPPYINCDQETGAELPMGMNKTSLHPYKYSIVWSVTQVWQIKVLKTIKSGRFDCFKTVIVLTLLLPFGSIWPHSMFNVGVLWGQFDPRLFFTLSNI